MSARIEEIIEVIKEVREQFIVHTNTPSIRDLRIVAVKLIASRRGIKTQTVQDKFRRQLEPDIEGTDEFDNYLEKWLIKNNFELKDILFKYISDHSDKNLINNAFYIAPAEDLFLSNEFGLDPNENEYKEGKAKLKIHLIKERNSSLVKKAKEIWGIRQNCRICCDVCSFSFEGQYGRIGEGYIEAHHIMPIMTITSEITMKVNDLAPVCSNCHKMLHRKKPWLTVDELKEIFNKRKFINEAYR